MHIDPGGRASHVYGGFCISHMTDIFDLHRAGFVTMRQRLCERAVKIAEGLPPQIVIQLVLLRVELLFQAVKLSRLCINRIQCTKNKNKNCDCIYFLSSVSARPLSG